MIVLLVSLVSPLSAQAPRNASALSDSEQNDCVALTDKLPRVVVQAHPRRPRDWGVSAGDAGFLYSWPDLPGFCEVDAISSARPQIKIKLWLPPRSAWSLKKRFLGTGNGGYGGSIKFDALASGLGSGFAVANTDLGTSPSTTANADALIGRPEVWDDFGFRATHEMTVIAKAVVTKYYGSGPRRSYFCGCSTGGQQGLQEAERYPDDYDGILVGDPAYDRVRVHAQILWTYRQLQSIPETDLSLVREAVLSACGGNHGFLENPTSCSIEPILRRLTCTVPRTESTGPQCLSTKEREAFLDMFNGLTTGGKNITFGIGPDADGPSLYGLTNQKNAKEPMFDSLFKWVFGAEWNWRDFNFDTDLSLVDHKLGPVLNATRPDPRYKGKLIMYHGFADPLISWRESLDYLERSPAAQRKNERLYLVPGMAHCFQGSGPNSFGAPFQPPVSDDPVVRRNGNILASLVNWVEQGVAPAGIEADKRCIRDGLAKDNDEICRNDPTSYTHGSLCKVTLIGSGRFKCE